MSDSSVTEIVQWASACLASLGFNVKNKQPALVQNTPWSYVTRFATSQGDIYLKNTPELLALEASVIQLLHNEFHANVPNVIALNSDLNCFLMKDEGIPLRVLLKHNFDKSLLSSAINQFTALQLRTADHLDLLFNLGVPDWRLDKIPYLFKKFLSEHDILVNDGLSESEIHQLTHLISKISNLCDKLSSYGIMETMVQPDFNDNNLLYNDKLRKITLIDLGEIVISHPFFQ